MAHMWPQVYTHRIYIYVNRIQCLTPTAKSEMNTLQTCRRCVDTDCEPTIKQKKHRDMCVWAARSPKLDCIQALAQTPHQLPK
jgi:hypothetical protein